jgi:formimidoylglutamate deiminase
VLPNGRGAPNEWLEPHHQRVGRLAPGYRADLIRLDADHPRLHGRTGDLLLDALVFSGNANPIQDVMVGGRWMVREVRHLDQERIAERYRQPLTILLCEDADAAT